MSNDRKAGFRLFIFNQYPKGTYGQWEIYGDDPNCDLGGYHSQPFLGIAEGKIEDVVDYAMDLPNFWCWGPGTIKPRKTPAVVKVDSRTNERVRLQKELAEMEAKVQECKDKLNKI